MAAEEAVLTVRMVDCAVCGVQTMHKSGKLLSCASVFGLMTVNQLFLLTCGVALWRLIHLCMQHEKSRNAFMEQSNRAGKHQMVVDLERSEPKQFLEFLSAFVDSQLGRIANPHPWGTNALSVE